MPFFKNSLFFILSILISFSLILNILKAFKELSGITGYNKTEIFLINSKEVYIIVLSLFYLLSFSRFFIIEIFVG